MDDEQRWARERERAEQLKRFHAHLSAYLVVNFALFVPLNILMNMLSGNDWWIHWPLLVWGIVLAAHALVVYGTEDPVGCD
jgi:hypothetical protein